MSTLMMMTQTRHDQYGVINHEYNVYVVQATQILHLQDCWHYKLKHSNTVAGAPTLMPQQSFD